MSPIPRRRSARLCPNVTYADDDHGNSSRRASPPRAKGRESAGGESVTSVVEPTRGSESLSFVGASLNGAEENVNARKDAVGSVSCGRVQDRRLKVSTDDMPGSSECGVDGPSGSIINHSLPTPKGRHESEEEPADVNETRAPLPNSTPRANTEGVNGGIAVIGNDVDAHDSPLLGSRVGKGDHSAVMPAKTTSTAGATNIQRCLNQPLRHVVCTPGGTSTSKSVGPRRSPRGQTSHKLCETPPLVQFDSVDEEDDIFVSQLRDQVGCAINLLRFDSAASCCSSIEANPPDDVVIATSSCGNKENVVDENRQDLCVDKHDGEKGIMHSVSPFPDRTTQRKLSSKAREKSNVAIGLTESALASESPCMKWANVGRNRVGFTPPSKSSSKAERHHKTPRNNQTIRSGRSSVGTPGKRRRASPLDNQTSRKRRLTLSVSDVTPGKWHFGSPATKDTPNQKNAPQSSRNLTSHRVCMMESTPPGRLSQQITVDVNGLNLAKSAKLKVVSVNPTGIEPIINHVRINRTNSIVPPSPAHQRHLYPSAGNSSSPGGVSDNDEDIAATQPVNMLVLDGVVAFVDVRTGSDNRSEPVRAQLRALGAVVMDRLTKNVTHVVFKDGTQATFDRARKGRLLLVSTLWVDACRRLLEKVDEALYPPIAADRYDSPLAAARIRKVRSMQPRTLEEELAAAEKRCQRRFKQRERQAKEEEQRPMTTPPDYRPPRRGCVAALLTPKAPACERSRRSGSGGDSDESDTGLLPLSVRLFNRFMTPSGNFQVPNIPQQKEEGDGAAAKLTPATSASPDFSANHRRRKPSSSAQTATNSQSGASAVPSTSHATNQGRGNPLGAALSSQVSQSGAIARDTSVSGVSAFSANVVMSSTRTTDEERKHGPSEQAAKEKGQVPEAESGNGVNSGQNFAVPETTNQRPGDPAPANQKAGDAMPANRKVRVKQPVKLPTNPRRRSARIRKCLTAERSRSLSGTSSSGGLPDGENAAKTSTKTGAMTAPAPRRRRRLMTPSEGIPSEELVQPVTPDSPVRRVSFIHPAMRPPPAPSRPSTKPTTARKRRRRVAPKSASVGDEGAIESIPMPRRSSLEFTSRPGAADFQGRRVQGRAVLTNLRTSERETMMAVLQKLGSVTIAEKVSASTTHVISGERRRTVSVLCGLAVGAWIVPPAWCLMSLEAGRWLPEARFEQKSEWPAGHVRRLIRQPLSLAPIVDINSTCVSAATVAPFGDAMPPPSRGSQQNAKGKLQAGTVYDYLRPPSLALLESVGSIFLSGQTRPPPEALSAIIRLAGGSLAISARCASVAIGRPIRGVDTVTELWLLDSVEKNELLDIERYRVLHPMDEI